MTWAEFSTLLSGLLPDTPLGQVVSIRCEKDPKRIRNFTPAQKRIHDEWAQRSMATVGSEAEYEKWMKMMERALCRMGGVSHGK